MSDRPGHGCRALRWFFVAVVGLLVGMPVGSARAGTFQNLGPEALLPLAEGWGEVSPTGDFPFHFVNSDSTGEISIYRSLIDSDVAIESPDAFRSSVDSVIHAVIGNLPEHQVLSNTGRQEEGRLFFALEFTAMDDAADESLHQRLVGLLYRHPDGHQLLFTLWARAFPSAWEELSNQVVSMQDGFTYRGPHDSDPFASDIEISNWFLLAAVVMLLTLVVMRFRRRMQAVDPTRWERRWRCDCGVENEMTRQICRECGQTRRFEEIN